VAADPAADSAFRAFPGAPMATPLDSAEF
jgi:hypothetical protein